MQCAFFIKMWFFLKWALDANTFPQTICRSLWLSPWFHMGLSSLLGFSSPWDSWLPDIERLGDGLCTSWWLTTQILDFDIRDPTQRSPGSHHSVGPASPPALASCCGAWGVSTFCCVDLTNAHYYGINLSPASHSWHQDTLILHASLMGSRGG